MVGWDIFMPRRKNRREGWIIKTPLSSQTAGKCLNMIHMIEVISLCLDVGELGVGIGGRA